MADTSGPSRFLADFERRPLVPLLSRPAAGLELDVPHGLEPLGLFLGPGARALEVLVTRSGGRPSSTVMREGWRERQKGRGVPLVVVALYGERAAVCGPAGEDPPVCADADPSVVERICATALEQPHRYAALRFLHGVLPHIDSELPGVRNEGFLTLHELIHGVQARKDFPEGRPSARRRRSAGRGSTSCGR